jgi:drug/metabolite transporter superfamily protein YnfA
VQINLKSMQKSILSLVGFILFLLGFLAICLNLIGGQFTFMKWMKDSLGAQTSMIIQFLMIVFGLILVILAQTNFGREK